MSRFRGKKVSSALEETLETPVPHDNDDPAKCTHCAGMLEGLQEIARLLRVSIPHDGAVIDRAQGTCKAATCWCHP